MINFSWHKGSLDESLKTTVTVSSFNEFYLLIKSDLSEFGFEVNKEDIDIKYYAYDDRIPEKKYLVTLKSFGVLGMINGTFDDFD